MFDLKNPEKIFTLAIVGLISLIVGTQIITVLSVNERSNEARTINLAGRQRMLSQKITKQAYQIQKHQDISVIASLQSDAEEWRVVQNGLEFGDENLGLEPDTFSEADSLFIQMRPYHEQIYNSVIALKDVAEIENILQTLEENEPKYLELMDAAVFSMESESERNNEKTGNYKLVFFFVILFLTGGIGYIFVRPLSRQIRNEFSAATIETRKHFKTVFEDSGIGIAFVNPEGKLFRINNFFCELLGYSEEEMLSMTFPEFTHPDDLEKDWSLFTEMVDGGRDYYQIDKRYFHKNGEIIWVTLSVSRIDDEHGKLDYVIAMIRDITEEKQLEKERSKKDQLFKGVFNSTFSFCGVANPDGSLIELNKPALEFAQLDPKDIKGLKLQEGPWWTSQEQRDKAQKAVDEARNGNIARFDLEVENPDGLKLIIDFSIVPVFDEEGNISMLIPEGRDVTEKIALIREVSEAKTRIEEAQKIAKIGNWQWDMIKDEITWSDLNYEVFGMPKSFKPNFEDLNAIIHPDDREPFQKDVETAIAENRDHDFVHRIVLKDGKEIRYIHERGKVFYNEDGKPVRMAGTSQDVTEVNEKEAKLEAQKTELNAINEKLQLSVEAGQVAIWIWDLETNELDWNDQAYKVFGVDKKTFEPTFENFATMIHPEDIIIVREATEKSIKTGDTFDIEFRFIWPDGEVRNLSGRGDVVFDEKGNPEKMIGINLDITERVKLYEKLKRQERQLRSFVQQAPVAVAMFDNEMRYITASNEWFKHNKIEQNNIVGQSHYEVIPEVRERKDWLEIHKRVLRGEEISRAKDQFATKDGEKIWLNWKAIPWYSVEGEIGGMIMYVSDISKDVEYTSQLENEVSERTLEVREQAKELKETNEELESFSYTISHDLRAPLRSINGFSDILLEEYAGQLDDEGKRLMNIVKQSAVTMGNLIDDILDFSRLGRKSLQKTDIDMNMLVESICQEEIGNYGEEKCNVNITELPNAKGDISLIKQVVTNLVSNAFKYSSHNELIKIDIDSYKKNKKNVYSFRDNGTGFKMEYHDKMFGVFQRLHSTKEFKGTGVGLAIVKRIINKHGGDVWAESEPGKGSTFFFSLPEN